jgi:iron complex outermembrane receptor protein
MQGISAFISAQLTYRSKTNAIVGGTADYNIDAYGLLDAQLGLASQSGWKAMLWGKNITNRYYWTNVVAGQDTIDRYPEKPATFGVSVGYTF